MLDQLQSWIEAVIIGLGYPGIVLVMAVENIFPPIPSELVLPFAGFLAGCQGAGDAGCGVNQFTLFGVVAAGTLGSLIGAVVLYYAGRWADERLIRSFVRRYGRYMLISEADLDVALGHFARRGEAAIFFGRLIPLVRSLISIPAGMQRMPMPKFLLYTTAGTALWSTILSVAGYYLGRNWPQVVAVLSQYQKLILAALLVGALVFVYMRLVRPRLHTNAANTRPKSTIE